MEHHLGLTCDPLGGQVQIPKRNAISAIGLINAAMAMSHVSEPCISLDGIAAMYETGKDMSAKYRETYPHGSLGKIQPRKRCFSVKYNTMNNDGVILSLCARLKGRPPGVSFDDPAACRSRARWHRHHQAYRRGGLNLTADTLISFLRALLSCIILMRCCFGRSRLRNFSRSYERRRGERPPSGTLNRRTDLNNKSSAPQSEEIEYSAALENSYVGDVSRSPRKYRA